MRVGLVTYGLDRNPTGVGRYTVELARAIAALDDGPELVLLTAGGLGALAETELRRMRLWGCTLLPGLASLGNLIISLLARHAKLDVVHDLTGNAPFLFRSGHTRTVVTVHDVFPWSFPGHSTLLDTLIHRHWLPRRLPKVDAVITDSRVSKTDITRYLAVRPSSIRVVYLAVDKRYRPASQEQVAAIRIKYKLPESYILYVGALGRRKNLSRLLRAYAHVRGMGERRPLVISGAGRSGYGTLERTLQECGLDRYVVFLGYVPDGDLGALYSGASLFVFPSLYEGFGLPPLEAMACGTPVVCSNAASLPEVVENAALTVDPYDVEALAEAMRQVLADAGLQEDLCARGLERARQFTWERTARETLAVYREVCA